jgi:hypothetical protein
MELIMKLFCDNEGHELKPTEYYYGDMTIDREKFLEILDRMEIKYLSKEDGF